ncbi:MAG: SPFH domain-containing protein, partial [Oscillospiraceae bacterium]
MLLALLILFVFILMLVITNIRVVPQASVYVIERLGVYFDTWNPGMHFLLPFLDRVSKRVSVKEQVVDFKPQPVITRDNVTMQIDTVVFFQVTDAKLFTYGVEHPM